MTESCDELLARNLKKIREDLGLSQAQVAQNIAYHKSAIGRKERNERPLYASDLKQLALALKLDFMVFISLIFEEPPQE